MSPRKLPGRLAGKQARGLPGRLVRGPVRELRPFLKFTPIPKIFSVHSLTGSYTLKRIQFKLQIKVRG